MPDHGNELSVSISIKLWTMMSCFVSEWFYYLLMKEENVTHVFPLSATMKIVLIVAFFVGGAGVAIWGASLFFYWKDASIFSAYLFFEFVFCLFLFVASGVYFCRYRLSAGEDGIYYRGFWSGKWFSFSCMTNAEFGKLGLGFVLVLHEGKKRLQIETYDLGSAQFEKLILLVKEGLIKSRGAEMNREVFSALQTNRAWVRSCGLFFVGYFMGTLLMPHDSAGLDDNDVGTVLYYGIGCERAPKEAARYLDVPFKHANGELEKAGLAALDKYRKGEREISFGDAYRIGCLYAGGTGVEKDEKEALRWFQEAMNTENSHLRRSARFMIDRLGF